MEGEGMGRNLLDRLGAVPDRRSRQGRMYPLKGLLAILLLASLQGESSLRGMWMWGKVRWQRLRWTLGFEANPRPPTYGTVWYVLARLDREELEKQFREWAAECAGEGTETVSLDGKTLRGSRRRGEEQSALEVVTAVGQELRQVLGQEAVSGGDVVSAAVRLLRGIPMKGKLVTADAGLLCRPFVEAVLEEGGDYLGLVKDNQPKLKTALEDWVEPHVSPPGEMASSGPETVE